jgi:hypothetical protein
MLAADTVAELDLDQDGSRESARDLLRDDVRRDRRP